MGKMFQEYFADLLVQKRQCDRNAYWGSENSRELPEPLRN